MRDHDELTGAHGPLQHDGHSRRAFIRTTATAAAGVSAAGLLDVSPVNAELVRRGAPRAVLMTASPNALAQRLFEGAGFRRTMVGMTRELDP